MENDKYFIDKGDGKYCRIITEDGVWPLYILKRNKKIKKYFVKRHPVNRVSQDSFIEECVCAIVVCAFLLLLSWLQYIMPYGLYIEAIVVLIVIARIYKIEGIVSGHAYAMPFICLLLWIFVSHNLF
ncbi:hypothetical protein DCCM_3066 [Desulfocucumis palustris]|uniref:Uncharacterized protein n=1 Tax=Desulfocucumis palustris TaxID=1898651 RepID=A0A2L2XCJ8_9FIRM|nr:hypothetical protein [Desulfocucumis palustris]GBF33955.1 hypothetical protein DCCM_3066 [Desulfocucumis palustris]